MSVAGGLDLASSRVTGQAHFTGGPPFLTGELSISARDQAAARLRPALVLHGPDGERELRGPVVAFWPGRQRRVRVKIEIGADVPPGQYRGMLNLGGLEVESDVFVTETVGLAVSPATIFVANRPGAAQARDLVVRNTGNVALPIGQIGPVPLYGTPPPGTRSDEQPEPAGSLTFGIRNAERLSVAAGETLLAPCQITVSEGLSDGDSYTGAAPLWNARVIFRVIPAGGADEPPPPQTPAAQTRPGETRPAGKRPVESPAPARRPRQRGSGSARPPRRRPADDRSSGESG
jgi:hypothetical protein